eukprot:gnl/Trimastix_PCT/2489.p1 GENE.gnl/Trimastix_PCT/2489~~gnl/Trimastix_PCT/2489.p1  ORF type:complete len:651 (-),score=167.98 gnl/Trimastix_PCT/2489:187-2079(-)
MKSTKHVLIIGAGMAGLSAGIHAQLNGYQSEIIEMHDSVGGLCTSWKRKRYEVDGCCHFLMGSSKDTRTPAAYHQVWSDLGVAEGCEFLYPDIYQTTILPNGKSLNIPSHPDKLEPLLKELSPEDGPLIEEMCKFIRMVMKGGPLQSSYTPRSKAQKIGWLLGLIYTYGGLKSVKSILATTGQDLQSFAQRAKSPLLRDLLLSLWDTPWTLMFPLSLLALCAAHDSGVPVHGSQHISNTVADRYRKLGGSVSLRERVVDLIIKDSIVCGVRTTRGVTHVRDPARAQEILRQAEVTEHRADIVIWTAEVEALMTHILHDKYTPPHIRALREEHPVPGHSFAMVAFGLRSPAVREQYELSTMGVCPLLSEEDAIVMGPVRQRSCWLRVFQGPMMVPSEQCSVVECSFWIPFESVAHVRYTSAEYDALKQSLQDQMTAIAEKYLPGFCREDIEMVDVVTPYTYTRYTGVRNGAICANTFRPFKQKERFQLDPVVPGLRNLLVSGMWLASGGGLYPAAMSGRTVVSILCEMDGKKFKTGPAPRAVTRKRLRAAGRMVTGAAVGAAVGVLGMNSGMDLTFSAVTAGAALGAGTALGIGSKLGALLGVCCGACVAGPLGALAGGAVGGVLGKMLAW